MMPPTDGNRWGTERVLVTPEAQRRLQPFEIMYHLGGFSDEGDSYDTQELTFERELDHFWADLVGPDEHLRQSILEVLSHIPDDWREVTVYRAGIVSIKHADGSNKTLLPPSDQ